MKVDCPGCMATGAETTGRIERNKLCEVCMGARWVDPDLVCHCGRAATRYSEKEKLWFCGRLSCAPKSAQAA